MLRVAPRLKRFHQLGQVRAELLRPEEDKELSNAALIAAANSVDRRGQLGHWLAEPRRSDLCAKLNHRLPGAVKLGG
jgi:hypothetical protein